jgi:lipoprotein-anchoring transpeptidase ErfK/SrfK
MFAALATCGPSGAAASQPLPAAARTASQPLPAAPTAGSAWVARIVIATRALTAPESGRVRMVIQTTATWDRGPVALLVLDARVLANGSTWLKVRLPQRPDGASAWIDSNFVELTRTPWRIDVSLERRTVSLLHNGRVIDRWQAVVGKPSTPTPRGLFAIYERLREPSPNDFLGTWALPLTAFSDALRHFEGGPGQVAIHGRGGASLLDPLGSARSHGCIRIDNSAIDVLARDTAEGTPVDIS